MIVKLVLEAGLSALSLILLRPGRLIGVGGGRVYSALAGYSKPLILIDICREVKLVYFVIVLVLSSIVISILKLKPSKHERMLSSLRERAIQDGLSLKVVWLKEFDWNKNASVPLQFTAYQHASSRQSPWTCVLQKASPAEWEVEGCPSDAEIERMNGLSEALGDQLIAVERRPVALIVYWIEDEVLYPEVYQYLIPKEVKS
ncbi:MAG: hypothetical protein KUG83_09375 [Gammaproteobacteria bacterium]|nr:hypothetical protein [Gammaproteobacteria bacterium]